MQLNTCRHKELSPYSCEQGKIYFPERLLEYIQSYCESNQIEIKYEKERAKFYVSDQDTSVDKLIDVQIHQYNFERWYNKLPTNLTFKSKLVKLTDYEKTAIKRISRIVQYRGIKDNDYEDLENLEKRLNEQMESKSWFLRLNTVSPKDVKRDQLPKEYQYLINNKIKDGKEILMLLTLSGRCFVTLKEDCDHYLILREWKEIPNSAEFRCFVSERKLRAISQYYWYDKFEYYQDPQVQKQLLDRITYFFNVIADFIPYSDAIVDIAIYFDDESKNNSYQKLGIYIIEFNPFGGDLIGGSALFNWIKDYDILYKSETPVLRVVEEV